MIVIPFVPGAFASTVEYVITRFTEENSHHRPVSIEIKDDGSMHNFNKFNHPRNAESLKNSIELYLGTNNIITPIYPFIDLHVDESFKMINSNISNNDRVILMYVNSIDYAELNMLFQYHKISIGLNQGLGIFFGNNEHNIIKWNSGYHHWSDMQPWEQREWLSLFYSQWVGEWIDAPLYMPNSLKISTREMLDNTVDSLNSIIEYCGLTKTLNFEFDEFVFNWRKKQQYVLNELCLINDIVDNVSNNKMFKWTKLNIIAEAIIQKKLRDKGYEIKCWNLNHFPLSTEDLYPLLEKCTINYD